MGKLLCSGVVLTLSSGWHMCNPLQCFPPLHCCWSGFCLFFTRLAARSSTVLPPPTLLLEQMLPVFGTVVCAILYWATPTYTTVGADAARFYSVVCATLYCAPPPYTTIRAGTARFFIRLAGRSLHCYPPAPRLNAAWFGGVSVGVLGDPLLCYPPTLHLG